MARRKCALKHWFADWFWKADEIGENINLVGIGLLHKN